MTHIDCDGQTCLVGRGVWVLEGFHKLYKMKLLTWLQLFERREKQQPCSISAQCDLRNIIAHKFQEENLESLYATNYARPC